MKITIFCGVSSETWSPKSEDSGIGGSEEMTIGIARELVKQGNEVTVYNHCGDDEGKYDGVDYVNYEYLPKKLKTDVLIVWRSPEYIRTLLSGVEAKKKYLWLHDAIAQNQLLPYIHFYDKIMVLSWYHRVLFGGIPAEKFFLTRNAVHMEQFDQKVEREPLTFVYGSSYDRGLKEVLEQWSHIKSAFKDAKLRIFYGWNTFDKIAELQKDKSVKVFKDYIEELMDQEGVTHLGRIGHKEVAQEYLRAGFWLYPTWWPEISCITAMKAQIGGAIPVVVPTAAVDETVALGYKTTTNPLQFASREVDEQTVLAWRDLVVQAAADQKTAETIRPVMQEFGRKLFGYDTLAQDWIKEFNG